MWVGICETCENGEVVDCEVCDIEENCHETIQIGEQVWMTENLNVTHYNNGEEIPNITNNGDWVGLTTGAYCDYDNNPTYSETYGRLYNWYTVDDDRGICPEGWHVPSDEEIKELEMFLGMSEEEANNEGWRGTDEGSQLAGNSELWSSVYSTNDFVNNPEFGTSGFNSLPAGYRVSSNGYYDSMGNFGYFWSSSGSSSKGAWYRGLNCNYSYVYRLNYDKHYGFSVRCLGD
ncbi:hypothetical protein EB821_04880 [Candidatus Marinimicrobia bacterium PRS2]|nr:hypothetical protein EB821_04880 [Candidatus Marinimicrobia bacterium PRS2]